MLELIMQVSRSAEDRLSGTVRLRERSELHHFSGTLELMRVFEELVPPVAETAPHAPTGWSKAPTTKPRGLS
jgi:hypothetical protein